jgi:hypothetical protein
MPIFAHPSGNGYTETFDKNRTIMLIASFGAMYLFYKRAWMAALLSSFFGHPLVFLLTLATASRSLGFALAVLLGGTLAWAVLMAPLVERSYRQRGWREIP